MLHYSVPKKNVAHYVDALLHNFGNDLRSITITTPEKSEASSVLIVINSSLVADVKVWTQHYYAWQQIT